MTRPDLFADYLREQLTLLARHYDITLEVTRTGQQIPFPYVLDASDGSDMGGVTPLELARHFPTTELADIGDELADGLFGVDPTASQPLALFDALRTDFSLARLRHYTGTAPEHFQRYILFTNYHRYVDEFVAWAGAQVGTRALHRTRRRRGGSTSISPASTPSALVADSAWRRHQMPAYHLIAPTAAASLLRQHRRRPSNAKTICDHLAVLRPEAWLMIGHCGGLRPSQRIGDYVPRRTPTCATTISSTRCCRSPSRSRRSPKCRSRSRPPPRSGVGRHGRRPLKKRMRTGTVVTTDDRNWELRYTDSALRFSQSRAIGIDMESATIAAQGYRFRVPYGTLLCVSDKPLHGELKLPGQANRFYEEAIAAHLQIGIRACETMRDEGAKLHSRKLRAFNEPPFR